MAAQLVALCVDAHDPLRLARFWSGLLGWEQAQDRDGRVALVLFCVIPAGNKFLAGCGFLGAVASDGSQEVGYFWSRALDWPLVWDQDLETAIRSPHGGPKITWGGPPYAPKAGRNQLRFDLAADGGPQAELDRLVALGAVRAAAGPGPSGEVEMTDPDGNEFTLWP